MKYIVAAGLPAVIIAMIAGCGRAKPHLNGAGATGIYPMMSKWAAEYHKLKGVEVNYQSIGSGGGIQQMTARSAEFGCTDAPMSEAQLREAQGTGGEVIHIPLVIGAVVPVYNLEEVKQPLRFSGAVLADIFLGKITKWNDKAIRDLNPDVPLPSKHILVVHRSDGSGNNYLWTEYLAQVSPEWKNRVGVGTSVSWPVGIGVKGGTSVGGEVRDNRGAIGPVELIYALHNNMDFGLVQNREGVFVRADLLSLTAAAHAAVADLPDDLRYSLVDAPGKNSYPICGTVWAILYVDQPEEKRTHLVEFFRWCTHEGQAYAAELYYGKLPESLVKRVDEKLDHLQTGLPGDSQ
jgi:phosphate transport system substrate-binding protein